MRAESPVYTDAGDGVPGTREDSKDKKIGKRRNVGVVLALAAFVSMSACGGNPPTGPSGPPAPAVYSITPAHGPASGGTSVKIGGANFAAAAVVTIGGVLATDVVVESAASISARTPARAPGPGDVVVSAAGKTATLPSGFTFDSGQPPVVSAVTVRGTKWTNEPGNFADLGETLNVTVSVQDPDTPIDQLKFEWTSDSGTFTGTGAAVQWRAPTTAATPATVTLNVAVTDGVARVTGAAAVRLHDSVKEVGDMARLFLLDFSDSNIGDANYILRNFSTGPRCVKERDDEKGDIEKNRTTYSILGSSIGAAAVNVQFADRPCSYMPTDGDACAAVPSSWTSLCLRTTSECTAGEKGTVDGTDFVTAVYEDSQWRLCASSYKAIGKARPLFIR